MDMAHSSTVTRPVLLTRVTSVLPVQAGADAPCRTRRIRIQNGHQHRFQHIGYLMPVYLSPLLFYGTHGSRCLYCVVLAMSWWVLGPLPKVANAFLLLLCPALLQVADPERLAASFFSADVLEATLLLLLSAADREIRSRLAPWLALRSHAEGMKLRWLFTSVCLGTFALATRISAALLTVVLFAIIDHGLRYLEETHVDNTAFGESMHFPADDAEHHHAVSPQHSQSGHTTPHRMADHPLNLYSPHLPPRQPTVLKAERPAAGAAFSGNKIPLRLTTAPQASSDRTKTTLTVPDHPGRELLFGPGITLLQDGTLAPHVSGTSSVVSAAPQPSEHSSTSGVSHRSSISTAGAPTLTDASGFASGRVISLQPVRHLHTHDDGASHKSTSFCHADDVNHPTAEAEDRHKKFREIRTAFLVGPVIMAVVGNVIGFWTLPSRTEMPLHEAEHGQGGYADEINMWLWALLMFPGVVGVVLFCCAYLYVANLQRHEDGWHTPEDHPIGHAPHDHREVARHPEKSNHLFLVYLVTYNVVIAYIIIINTHLTQVWTWATLVVVASSVSQQFGDRHAFGRHHLLETMPWNVICVLGGTQLITHLTVEGQLVEHLFELVSPSFWRTNSRVTNQVLLTGLSCLLTEAVGVAPLCRLLRPIIISIASETGTRLLYYLVPVSVALSTNMISPMTLPLALLHCARNVSVLQLAIVGLAGKSILLTMVLLSVNTTGSYFFIWSEVPMHRHNQSVAVAQHGLRS
ncbi:hypothetical protein MTO96_022729 [Rhipicephalus appendiculatus]